MAPFVYQVSELIRDINVELYGRYRDVLVEGEVTNFSRSTPGHCYFSIKDARAQLGVVLFATSARAVKFKITNGLKVIVRGRLGVYEQSSRFQLNATSLEPVGLGALQLAFEQLKERLAAEGLFDSSWKSAIPRLPQRIAVVTSPTGAAVRDILHVLERRFAGISIQIYPVRVQGVSASSEISRAILNLSRWQLHDVILLCRGGGSLEDLWPFNEEKVARAIAACEIPIISGIGHEVDFTIADFVSDLRAPTPSAAAEVVIQAKGELCSQIDSGVRRIRHIVQNRVRTFRNELRHFTSSDGLGRVPLEVRRSRERLQTRRVMLFRIVEGESRGLRQRLAKTQLPLANFPARVGIIERRRYIALVADRSGRALRKQLDDKRSQVAAVAATLEAVSPLSVLSRGYALAFSQRGGRRRVLTDSAAISIGDPVHVKLRRGAITCTVDQTTIGAETLLPVVSRPPAHFDQQDLSGSRTNQD